MRLPLLLAALAVPVSPLAAQAPAPPPATQDQAMTLPPDALADLVFRQMGARMASVTRPGRNETYPSSGSLSSLVFATAPYATPTVGLCAANRAEVEFQVPVAPPFSANGPETPARARLLRAAEVYKVVGEIEPHVEVSEERAAEEDRRCAGAGPVIPASLGDRSSAFFFDFEGAVDPVTALLTLQRAIAEAQAGRYSDIGCTGGGAECRQPAALLGRMRLTNLLSVRISPAGVDAGRYLIGASFLIGADDHFETYWSVALEAEISDPDGGEQAIGRLGRAEIARHEIIGG